jgi:oxalate---CoA ligase
MKEVSAQTVDELLLIGKDSDVALAAPSRPPLSYAGLRCQANRTAAALSALGIKRNDRVAIVLPNGPEMASAFLCVAAAATTTPLNPAYRESEFEFYLSDLKAKALMVEHGSSSPAVAVAKAQGLRIIEIKWVDDHPAGSFTFLDGPEDGTESSSNASPADAALVLHTSGTTSRPKMVPLSQLNLAASAQNIVRALDLSSSDRCLSIMPLFHIHGLMAAVLASIAAGASVFCCPAFNTLRFYSWLDEANPTWYTAVPTMHQTILARAERNRKRIENARLRLIRSSSASLPPQVMKALEETFGAPVIESYGMTEAAHQMASNPLPPKPRKAGSVGLAAGPEVEVMDATDQLLKSGEVGEVVIRGTNVFESYENNPEATSTAFTDGWFRTGDQGVKDAEGYLSITGRHKELINRGGEKISPLEVDEVIMDHPDVAQVATFALPHDTLGEDVAAAVVLNDGATVELQEIREFVAERLAAFKVPRQIIILDEIPKGATGKLQRIGLAEKLGLV